MVSMYRNIFAKGYMPNWLEKVFVITKVKNAVLQTCVISDRKGEEIVEKLYEKELQKPNPKKFRVENVIKTKGDKLYVKWKDYNNSFNINSWVDKKDTII